MATQSEREEWWAQAGKITALPSGQYITPFTHYLWMDGEGWVLYKNHRTKVKDLGIGVWCFLSSRLMVEVVDHREGKSLLKRMS